MSLGNVFISGVYSLITMKFGMKVGLRTLITGKLLWSGYLGNGCHGDQIALSELYNGLFWIWSTVEYEYREAEGKWKWNIEMWVTMETICCHSNKKICIIWSVLAVWITYDACCWKLISVTVLQTHWLQPLERGKALVQYIVCEPNVLT